VTRFQKRNEPVLYEIAQVKIIVDNISPESESITGNGIVVYAEEKA
jgi:hypothetical protein